MPSLYLVSFTLEFHTDLEIFFCFLASTPLDIGLSRDFRLDFVPRALSQES